MLLTDQAIQDLHHKYAPDEKAFELVFTHCTIVNEIAQWCAGRLSDAVDTEVLRNACLLHDIGTYALANTPLYPQHAMLGAKILEDEGLDPAVWQAVETHVLMGLSKEEIAGQQSSRIWALPAHDYFPRTLEAELLCYADRFNSKAPAPAFAPTFNDYQTFLTNLQKSLPLQAEKFERAAQRFGLPDITALAEKYQQPIR